MRRTLPLFCFAVAVSTASVPGSQEGAASAPPRMRFVDVTDRTGIDFSHFHGGTDPVVIYEEMGPGAALFDYDDDGDLDLYLVQGAHRRFPAPEGVSLPRNRLYRNQGNDGNGVPRFEDVTEDAGVGDTSYGMGVAVGDVDNDGDPDLYVSNYGPNVLYLNQGDGTFRDVTAVAGVGDERMSASAAFADVDGDGLLDLYVTNYLDFLAGPEHCEFLGVLYACSDLEYPGLPNSLYLNLGPGDDGTPRFREAAKERGALDEKGRGLGVSLGDLDQDGIIDLYIANDGGGNVLLINNGKGHFRDRTLISGTGYSEAGMGEAGMGTCLGDYDGDGRLDIFVTNFARETNALYRNDGKGLFSYATVTSGLNKPSFLPLGWGTVFFDADLDGDLDLFVANGHLYEQAPLLNPQDNHLQPNQLFRNNGDGTFTDVSAEAGPGLAVQAASRGLAVGDVDRDGDLDLYVTANGGPGALLLNETERRDRHGLQLELVGGPSNRDAVGARLTIKAGDLILVRQWVAGGSYLSHGEPRSIIGIGAAAAADRVEIVWPSGSVQELSDVPADRLVTVEESSKTEERKETP